MRRLISKHSRRLAGQAVSSRRLICPQSVGIASSNLPAVHRLSLPQASAFFSTTSTVDVETDGSDDDIHERVELDPSLPLSFSVNTLLRIPLGKVHRLDFYTKFPNMMRACGKAGKLDQVQLLLERMLQEKRETGRVVPAKVFETAIFAWAKNAKREAKKSIRAMLDIVKLMEQQYEYDYQHALMKENDKGNGDSCQPRTETYNTILRGMAEAAPFLPNAARDAERLLDTMESLHRERSWDTKPNNRSFTYVITAYGNVGSHDSGDLAEAVLERMKQTHKLQVEAFEATNNVPYNQESQGYRKQVVTPDRAAYTATIRAHAKSRARQSADKAYAVLTEMHQNVRPDAVAITTCINAFVDVAGRSSGRVEDRVPAHERAEAAASAEALLMLMGDLAKEEETASTAETEVIVEEETKDLDDDINEWNGADNHDDDKQTGKSLRPTVITYNSVLNAFSRSDTQEAAPRANALLQRMIEDSLNDASAVKPNRTSFNSVLNAWARYSRYDPEAPVKAEELLNLMYDLYYSGRLETVKPDGVTYSTLINAWARSGDRQDKVQNARRLLNTMLSKYDADEEDMRPNVMAYTSVLNAAVHSPASSLALEADGGDLDSFTSEAEDAAGSVYSILMETYEELLKDPYNVGLAPDHFVFSTMLQAIRQHTDHNSAERRQMVESVFDDACAAGEVSSFVIRALRDACPSIDLLERLLRSPELARELRDVSQLPQEWTRNVDYSPKLRKVDRGKRRGGQRKRTGRRTKRDTAKAESQ